MNNLQKQLVIFGSGGHGWESIKQYIDDFEGEVLVSMLPVDWGGSTGTIGRLLKRENGEFNEKIHKNRLFPIMPFGDMNKFILTYLLEKCPQDAIVEYREKKTNALDFRSDSYEALSRVYSKITHCMGVDEQLKYSFFEYLHSYLEHYLEYKDLLNAPKTTALGNMWHSFLFYNLGSIANITKFYHNNSILHKKINLIFTSTNRQILRGRYYNESQHEFYLDGEDKIDTSDFPIDPESFHLLPSISGQKQVIQEFLTALKNADLIIIPNGSIANWLPLLNEPDVLEIMQEKSRSRKLVWIMNLFHAKNEYPFDVYYHYLVTKDVNPIILGPNKVPPEYYVSFLKQYQKEGKTLNYNFNTTPHEGKKLKPGFNNCLDVITHKNDPSVEGLKYDKQYLKNILSEFFG